MTPGRTGCDRRCVHRRGRVVVLLAVLLAGACTATDGSEDRTADVPAPSTDASTDPGTGTGDGPLPTPASGSGPTTPAADDPGAESVGIADDVTIEVRDP